MRSGNDVQKKSVHYNLPTLAQANFAPDHFICGYGARAEK
jgi:hypothetical protein